MKYLDEYRDARAVRHFAEAISGLVTRPWSIMEVCGGQTHAIVRFGLDELLPDAVTLLHGPGCPVCVTPIGKIDLALALAERPEIVLCSFGDMLRVPGSRHDLFTVKSAGGDVRVVYSPLDALALARRLPEREVVFFAVGFETTAPANAMAAYQAKREGIDNFSLLASHVLVPPALAALLEAPERRMDGFLAAGHVCTIMGTDEYRPLVERYQVPIVATGFEPVDILQGLYMCLRQLEAGQAEVENQYARAVRPDGNIEAVRMIREVFEVVRQEWRGMGAIAASGLALRAPYAAYDAERKFGLTTAAAQAPAPDNPCISGLILQGARKPPECPAFGGRCTPDFPLGATMVSAEGACAAYHRYRKAVTP